MTTDPKTLAAAKAAINSRRSRAEAEAELRRRELEQKLPELVALEDVISGTSVRLARLVLDKPVDIDRKIEDLRKENTNARKRRAELLASHGFNETDLKPHHFCEICSDTGFVSGAFCQCLRAEIRAESFRELSMNGSFSHMTFDNFDLRFYSDLPPEGNECSSRDMMAKAAEAARNFAENFPKGNLLFMGPTGVGKTHLSLSIAKTVIDKGKGVIYISAPDMFSRLERDRFGSGEKGRTVGELQKADLLIVDDLGAEMKTTFTESVLYQIVNSRLNEGIPTVISTNLTPLEMRETYNDRICSRIFGCYTACRFVGTDIRQLKRSNSL